MSPTNVRPGISDPALYRRMSLPFESDAAAAAAMEAFYTDLRALREHHRIPEVVVVFAANVTTADGREVVRSECAQMGAGRRAEALLLRALYRTRFGETLLALLQETSIADTALQDE